MKITPHDLRDRICDIDDHDQLCDIDDPQYRLCDIDDPQYLHDRLCGIEDSLFAVLACRPEGEAIYRVMEQLLEEVIECRQLLEISLEAAR